MQNDLFPETLVQGYIDVDFCDLSEPAFRFTEATNFYSQQNLNRINYLLNIEKNRYFIFRHDKDDPDSLPFIVDNKTGKRRTPSETRNLYPSVCVVGKTLYMHSLVGLYFLENDMPDVKNSIDHLDGDHKNYRVNNLQWVNQSENMRRRYAT